MIETRQVVNTMLGNRKWMLLSLATILALATLPPIASAQTGDAASRVQLVRTLVINDSQVIIDGKQIDPERLPAVADLGNISVSYSFVGVEMPLVTLGDQLFAVHTDRLEAIESDGEHWASLGQRKRQDRQAHAANGWIVDSDRAQYYTFQGERLEVNEAVPRLLQEANTLYLDELARQNERLYNRLGRELALERQAEILAISARSATTREEQDRHIAALTQKLENIFELKQQNRRDEIAQFEAELDRLKARVAKRDELKDQIIRERIVRLTGREP